MIRLLLQLHLLGPSRAIARNRRADEATPRFGARSLLNLHPLLQCARGVRVRIAYIGERRNNVSGRSGDPIRSGSPLHAFTGAGSREGERSRGAASRKGDSRLYPSP